LTIYLDASVLVSLLVDDANTASARHVADRDDTFVVSAWTLAECSSAFARWHRMGHLTVEERESVETELDSWASHSGRAIAMAPEDFAVARSLVRHSRLGLRAPDALHLAAARRSGYALATFDVILSAAAREAGVELIEL
jgi:predicted nucleic acid-binding protein